MIDVMKNDELGEGDEDNDQFHKDAKMEHKVKIEKIDTEMTSVNRSLRQMETANNIKSEPIIPKNSLSDYEGDSEYDNAGSRKVEHC